MTVRAFPWGELDALRSADVAALRSARRLAGRTEDLARALGEIAGGRASIALHDCRTRARMRPMDRSVGVRLELDVAAGTAALVEIDTDLARELARRVVQRPAGGLVDPSRSAGTAVTGVVAAVVAAVLRRARVPAPLRVSAAGEPSAIAPDLPPDALTATLRVELDGLVHFARITWRPTGARARAMAWDVVALRSLGGLPIAMEIVAAASIATAEEIASLRVGDAWVPGDWPLSPGTLVGRVVLASAASERAVSAALVDGGKLVLRGDPATLAWVPEDRMTQEATAEALGDAPVVVRVEVGTAQMLAREWAELCPGDVVTLGRKLGEPVILRAGGVEIARGELVQVDGEVGVRILERR